MTSDSSASKYSPVFYVNGRKCYIGSSSSSEGIITETLTHYSISHRLEMKEGRYFSQTISGKTSPTNRTTYYTTYKSAVVDAAFGYIPSYTTSNTANAHYVTMTSFTITDRYVYRGSTFTFTHSYTYKVISGNFNNRKYTTSFTTSTTKNAAITVNNINM